MEKTGHASCFNCGDILPAQVRGDFCGDLCERSFKTNDGYDEYLKMNKEKAGVHDNDGKPTFFPEGEP